MKPIILSFFITNYGDAKPILFYPEGKPVQIDIHLMMDNLSLDKHQIQYILTDGNDNELGSFTQSLDLSDLPKNSSYASVAEITAFAVFDENDPLPEKFVEVIAIVDESTTATTKFYLMEAE